MNKRLVKQGKKQNGRMFYFIPATTAATKSAIS